ncbi:MAG: SpoVR family protein [Cryobacterium sp.]|nr:SpoVR family protein [Oligoflexia bacterium]
MAYGFDSSDLTPELKRVRDEIEGYARGYGLDFFDTIFEMIDHDQMNAFAAYGGFPVRYPHWRFGMDFDQLSKGYEYGLQKIYEMVINTNPSYAYLMKSNTMVEQKTVMAHVFGHVDFFKNNYWFSKTNRKMLDTMANHAVRIRSLMEKLGQEKVEDFIDRVLAIENLIDPFAPFAPSPRADLRTSARTDSDDEVEREAGRLKVDRGYMEKFINPPQYLAEQKVIAAEQAKKELKNPPSPMKDVLAFLLANAPLQPWEHDVLAMLRDEAYYFAPQAQTKIMNEGWASYWHSKIMTTKALKASEVIDFCDSHAGTLVTQPGRLNPYKVGIELFRDIEDRWDRGAFGKEFDECDDLRVAANWDKKLGLGRQKIFEVRKVCNDITFIDQYMTADFCERQKLYNYGFNKRTNQYEIIDRDYKKVKEKLLFQLTNRGQPFIYVTDGNLGNKGELLLWHKHMGMDLDAKWTKETMRSLAAIWKRPVNLETEVENQKKLYTYVPAVDGLGEDDFSEKLT